MKLIFKNFRDYWFMVVPIFILLIVQAFCDLALPDYTSAIIDTGIASSGIEHAVPQYLSKSGYKTVMTYLTDEEKAEWENAYQFDDDNYYYVLKDASKSNWEMLDEKFQKPIAIVYMLTGQQNSMFGNSDAMPDMSDIDMSEIDMSQMQNMDFSSMSLADIDPEMLPPQFQEIYYAYSDMLAQMGLDIKSPTLLLDIRGKLEEQLATLGDSMIFSMAKNYSKAEYEACDIDITKIQKDYMWRIGAKMLGMSFGMAVCSVLVGFLASRTGAGVGKKLRRNVFSKVIGFSNAELDKFSTASLITRSTNDVQQIQFVTVILLRIVLYAPILAIGGIINIQRYKSGMAWIIILAVALVVSLIAILMVVAMPKFKIMQDLVDRVNLISREILTGLPVIRAFSREKTEEERFEKANQDLTNVMLFTNRAMVFMMPAMMIIMNGVSVLIVWTAAKKIDAGVLEVGSMTAFITYAMLIIMGFLMLTMVSIMLPRAAIAANRIQEILDTKEIITEKADAQAKEFTDATITFEHVSFKYPDGEENVLEDIDFVARPGQTTAIIGSTGCGKSTLVKLIPRFFDVSEGSIKIGGVDIRDQKLDSLRGQIGYVPQKGILFSGDIKSNIAYGAPDITEEGIKEAARIAQAESFIEEKPEKYESSISQGGGNVSGGQKQRLAIARAIARDPKIYIFDDSFSALDFKTDTALRKALSEKTENGTVLIVAQRVSTILNADQILVLEEGKLIGKGKHKDLVETCETYRQIAQSQLSEKEFAASIAEETVNNGNVNNTGKGEC